MIRKRLARIVDVDHPAAVIARTDVVTTGRSLRDNGRELASLALLGAFLLQMQFLLLEQMIAAGDALVGADPPIERVAGALASVVAFGAYSGAHQVVQGSDSGTLRPLLSTSAPPRAVALGRSLADYLKLLAFLSAFTALPLVGIGIGARTPLVPAALVVGALPLAWGGLLVGRAVGMAIRSAYRRIPGVQAIKFVFVVAVFLVGVVWWMRGVEDGRIFAAASTVISAASISPLRAYVRALLAPIGAPVAPVDVAVSAGVLLAVLATTVLVVRFEAARDARERPNRHTGTGSRSVPTVIATAPSLRIAWRYLLLGGRQPSRFSHLIVLFIAPVSVGAPALADPSIAVRYAPELGVVIGTALAGGAYCLNPLGDDREQHALLLTASPTLRPVLWGRGVAGIAVASVFLVLCLVVGALDGRVIEIVGYLAIAAVLFPASVGTALGFGAAVPSYEPTDDGGTIQPSTVPTMVHLFGAMVVGALGAWLVVVTAAGVPLPQLAVGWVLYLATICASGYLGYRNALRRVDALTLDAY